MITYAGQYLASPTSEIAAWVGANIPPDEVFPFAPRYSPSLGLASVPFRAHLPPGPVRVGRLHYPWGASRFAVGHFLVDSGTLGAIRAYCQNDSASYRAAPLVLDGGDGVSITTDLWMLPARPLAQINNEPGLWLLTLVDERYFWWLTAASVSAQSTWALLYAAIGTALGVTIEAETVASAYLTPPAELAGSYPALPLLLDAVATSVGHRIVRLWDGTIKAQSATTARASWLLQQQTYGTRLMAGGSLAI